MCAEARKGEDGRFAMAHDSLGKLCPAFVGYMETSGWPSRDSEFGPWFRKRFQLRFEVYWMALKKGEPVPLVLAEGIVEYAREKLGWNGRTAESVIKELHKSGKPIGDREGVWRSWRVIADTL